MVHRVRKVLKIYLVMIFLFPFIALSAYAQVPMLISYQGKLTDIGGTRLDGVYWMKFSLYNLLAGGTCQWTEQQSVAVTNGIFDVQLGSVTAFSGDEFDNTDLYLEVEIFESGTGWEILEPRERLTSTAFCMRAEAAHDADTVGGQHASDFALSVHTHSGDEITSGQIADAQIADSIARDTEITWDNLALIPAGFADGLDDTGITTESDPTVPSSVKDGISWLEISNRPSGLDDGDDVGITSESDPEVGSNTFNYISKWNGSSLVTSSIFDNNSEVQVITHPDSLLHVAAVPAGDAKLILEADTDNNNENDQPLIELKQDGGSVKAQIGFDESENDLKIKMAYQDSHIRFYTGPFSAPTEKMRMTGNGRLGIGTEDPSEELHVKGSGFLQMAIESSDSAAGMRFINNNDYRYEIQATPNDEFIIYDRDMGEYRLLIQSDGDIGVGTTSPNAKLMVSTDTNPRAIYGYASSTSGVGVYGRTTALLGAGISAYAPGYAVIGHAENTTTNCYGGFFQAECPYGDGVYSEGKRWDYYANGDGGNYGPFTGAHEVKLSDNFPKDIKTGMIVSVTGEAQTRLTDPGSVSISSTLPTVKLSDIPNDKAVLGAFLGKVFLNDDHWYMEENEERFAIVNALGEGRVWVSNIINSAN